MAQLDQIKKTFRRFDLNGDGLIQLEELQQVLMRLDPDAFSAAEINRLFSVWANDRGAINYDSFCGWLMGDEQFATTANKLSGVVLWADSDIRVTDSANLLKNAGLEVRAFSETAEILQAYLEYSKGTSKVLAIISSTMESGGRKERGCDNAKTMFGKLRAFAYQQGLTPPIFAIISASASPPEYWAAGADVITIGRREKVQEKVLRKLQRKRDVPYTWVDQPLHVFWCDSNPKVSTMSSEFCSEERPKIVLHYFPGVEEMVAEFKDWDDSELIAAVISSTMESGGRKEKGLMNGFQGFAEIRRLLENKPARPYFAIVSASSQTEQCYMQGADICICKDNEFRRSKQKGSMWHEVAADVVHAFLSLKPPPVPIPKDVDSALDTDDTGFPSYWKSRGDDFSNMVALEDDDAVAVALNQVLQDTFKRKDPSDPQSPAVATRDRGDGKETINFRLAQAFRIEDSHMWKHYATCRRNFGNCQPFADVSGPGGEIKTRRTSGLPSLATACNEAFLFHGTNPDAAQGIVHTGFRIDLAGTAAGTMFGKGAYLAESSTKSDEYAKPGTGAFFGQMYAMLLCRAALGPVVRVEESYHSNKETKRIVDEDIVRDKKFGCLLGDREARVGTYREYIVFDKDQIYPEFVLLYRRVDAK